jgi:hypothetical protein
MDGHNSPFDDGGGPHNATFVASRQPLPGDGKFRDMQADPNRIRAYTYSTKNGGQSLEPSTDPILQEYLRTGQRIQANHVTVVYGGVMPPGNKDYFMKQYKKELMEDLKQRPDYKRRKTAWGHYSQGMCLVTGVVIAGIAYWIYSGQALYLF